MVKNINRVFAHQHLDQLPDNIIVPMGSPHNNASQPIINKHTRKSSSFKVPKNTSPKDKLTMIKEVHEKFEATNSKFQQKALQPSYAVTVVPFIQSQKYKNSKERIYQRQLSLIQLSDGTQIQTFKLPKKSKSRRSSFSSQTSLESSYNINKIQPNENTANPQPKIQKQPRPSFPHLQHKEFHWKIPIIQQKNTQQENLPTKFSCKQILIINAFWQFSNQTWNPFMQCYLRILLQSCYIKFTSNFYPYAMIPLLFLLNRIIDKCLRNLLKKRSRAFNQFAAFIYLISITVVNIIYVNTNLILDLLCLVSIRNDNCKLL